MADERSTSNLFNPWLAWADLSLRAAEMTTVWFQTVNDTFDRIARARASLGLAQTPTGPVNPLQAVRTSLRPSAWGEKPAVEGTVGSLTYPAQRKRRAATEDLQHAMASGEAKPRRKPAAKRKGARRTARKSA
jgi:hypothetical protein